MNLEQLKQFCCDDPCKTNINAPWSLGDKSYATNGHILIIVDRIEGIEENKKAIDMTGKVLDPLSKEPVGWYPVPMVGEVAQEPCKHCKGTGKAYTCPECEGEGEVCPSTGFNDYYEQTCMSCEGVGSLSKEKWLKLSQRCYRKDITDADAECEECYGTGKNLLHNSVEVGGALFSDLYLFWLSQLPNCEIGVFNDLDPARIRFDGGEGLIMPRRKD